MWDFSRFKNNENDNNKNNSRNGEEEKADDDDFYNSSSPLMKIKRIFFPLSISQKKWQK